jgi:hypothetical protein
MRAQILRRSTPSDLLDEAESPTVRCWSRRTRAAFALARAHRGDWNRWHIGVPLGAVTVHPYVAPEAIAFSLACLEQLPPNPSRLKPLLSDALDGLLPQPIAGRREKIDYNDAFYTGLSNNLPQLERLASLPALADLGLLEPAVLLECLHRSALGMSPSAPAVNRLSKALALALWLDRRERPATAAAEAAETAPSTAGMGTLISGRAAAPSGGAAVH